MFEDEEIPFDYRSNERRAENRLRINAGAEVSGRDILGNSFVELTKIQNFSDVGCQFQLLTALVCGSTVSLRPIAPNEWSLPKGAARLFEVMWTAPCATGWMVGVRVSEDRSVSVAESGDTEIGVPEQEACGPIKSP